MEVWKSGVEIFFHTTGWELCWNPLKSTENFMAQTNYPRKPWSNVVLWISNSFTPITNQFPTSGVEKNFHTGFPHLHFHTGFPTRWSVWKCQMYDANVLLRHTCWNLVCIFLIGIPIKNALSVFCKNTFLVRNQRSRSRESIKVDAAKPTHFNGPIEFYFHCWAI